MSTTSPTLEKNKREKTAAERKKQIFDAAIHLFLEKGVANTSMREMAVAVGMTTGGLYHYVKSKDEIVRMVTRNAIYAHESVKALRKSLGDVSPTKALRVCTKYWLTVEKTALEQTVFLDRERVHMGFDSQQAYSESVQSLIHFFEDLLNDGIKTGEFEIDNVSLVAFNIYMSRIQFATKWWLLKDLFTAEEYAAQQTNSILKQILVDRSRINQGGDTTTNHDKL
ncbi:MAG TPA: TetR/AcrR family transcriptional regulator [Dehalococcoidia bacterium]|nr:TetR/AcrR family transcriptional regulator [Dehalococcoidia bacterium]